MIIETKYNIGDEVWFMDGLEPVSKEILRIDVEVYNVKTIIEYDVMLGDVITGFYEHEIFPTKEELLKSLQSMKLYTDEIQTAKLIELGFEKPKHTFTFKLIEYNDVKMDIDIPVSNYSIGELLSFLPKSIKVNDLFFTLCIHSSNDYWIVEYADIAFGTQARLCKEELIDALFAEIVILKEEGVI